MLSQCRGAGSDRRGPFHAVHGFTRQRCVTCGDGGSVGSTVRLIRRHLLTKALSRPREAQQNVHCGGAASRCACTSHERALCPPCDGSTTSESLDKLCRSRIPCCRSHASKRCLHASER